MMELSLEQIRFIKSRKNGYKLLKGICGSGKTTAVINRIPTLIKSYAPEKSDNVLVAALSDDHLEKLSSAYENIGRDKYTQSSFFDEENFHKLKINTIDSLVLYYFEQYKKHHKFNASIGRDNDFVSCILKAVSDVKEALKRNTKVSNEILNENNIKFLKKEIQFIKESNISSLDEYQNVVRNKNDIETSLKINIRKNCKARKIIYTVFKEYNKNLKALYIIDKDDINLLALKEAGKKKYKIYTQIVID
ncbi:MAG: UvrD-helicase domain-containing protein, partial [Romboutsia sp.]|nr:UvrD-helicase domain-containing protein [Romboutsia sp.]